MDFQDPNTKKLLTAFIVIGVVIVVSVVAVLLISGDDTTEEAVEEITEEESDSEEVVAEDTAETIIQTGCISVVQNATVDCSGDTIVIESNGLPTHEMMVGIQNGGWNGQWPEAQDYTGSNAFFIPKTPTIASTPTYEVKNAAGVAANGIPIFFPYAPGGGSCLDVPGASECYRDPVADGEMDVCGGHTGRGNDYHYHASPNCLLGELADGAIAGYMLDGIPVYADPIDGSSVYNECGGYVSTDGLIHYAFTEFFPYVTSCLLGEFSEGPKTSGSNTYTGGIDSKNAGSIEDYFIDGDGCQNMTFSSGVTLTYCGN